MGEVMEENVQAKFEERLKELLNIAKKKKNVLEYQEINDFFHDLSLEEEQFDKILETLEQNNVDVLRITDVDDVDDEEIILTEEDDVDVENIDLSVPDGVSIEDPNAFSRSASVFTSCSLVLNSDATSLCSSSS